MIKEADLPGIPYGISHFEAIRTDQYLYVDKTRFIEEIEKMRILIHLRPRRFGKSLFLSMLASYYDVAKADQFDQLFGGLYIHEHPTQNRHQYYVLRFNFSGVQTTRKGNLEQGFLRKVAEGAQHFIDDYDLHIKLDEKETEPAGILGRLFTAFRSLKLAHKVYILIDEYDHFTNTLLTGDSQSFLELPTQGDFVRAFYEVIKEYAELGIVDRFFATGVLSVSLDSMTSGFNVAKNTTTNRRFADMMGFTAKEVENILQQFTLSKDEQAEVYQILKENYNGYLFSKEADIQVFNSTLIMYYLDHYLENGIPPEELVDPNLNQGGTTIENIVGLKTKEENHEVIKQIIEEKQVLGTLLAFIDLKKKFDRHDFMTLLFNIGLLTIKQPGVVTTFEIPNKVMDNIYLAYLVDLTQQQSNYRIDLKKQELALVEMGQNGNIQPLTDLVSDFLTHIAVRNKQKFDEKDVKLVYMMLLATNNQFITYDEFPAGQGFIDLFIQKTPASYAQYEYVIELKYLQKKEATPAKIEQKLKEGLKQMDKYLVDERIAKRESLKKLIIVFSGFEAIKVEEINSR